MGPIASPSKAVATNSGAAAAQATGTSASPNAQADKWFQCIRDALYAIEQFFNEKKSGQFSATVISILQFVKVVLHNDVATQFYEQFKAILSERTYLDLMRKGLITKPGATPQQGEFFLSPATKELGFTVMHNDSTYTLPLRGTLGILSLFGKKVDNHEKATKVSFYVCAMFAQSFCSFILKHGPTFMAKADRDTICGMTVQERVSPPYNFGERISAMKDLLIDAADDEWIGSLVNKNFGSNATRTAKTIIKSVDPNKIGDSQACLAEALLTRKIAPIKRGIQDFLTSVAGNAHAKDGIKSYRQR
jgi:hypothetical protein